MPFNKDFRRRWSLIRVNTLLKNEALLLDVTSHVTSFNQSEYNISVWVPNNVLKKRRGWSILKNNVLYFIRKFYLRCLLVSSILLNNIFCTTYIFVQFQQRTLTWFVMGSITEWLTSCLAGLDSTKQVNMFLI